MAENRIRSTISAKELTFGEGTPTKFTVSVINQSNIFASFQLKLELLDLDPQYEKESDDWYKISPVVSSKNPPGDSTEFEVEIIKIPTGGKPKGDKISCLVVVSSIDLPKDQDRIPFDIKAASITLQVSILRESFYRKLKPGELWKIGIEIYNPSFKPANVLVELLDLNPKWLKKKTIEPPEEAPAGQQKKITLPPKERPALLLKKVPAGQQKKVTFDFQPDKSAVSKTDPYSFTIRVSEVSDSNSKTILKEFEGKLEILPKGELNCSPIENESDRDKLDKYKTFRDFLHNLEKTILQTLYGILLWRKHNDETYKFKLENKSNLPQEVSIKIDREELEKFKEVVTVDNHKETNLAPGKGVQQSLKINAEKAPLFWLFGEKILDLKIKASWSDPRVNTRNETHIVKFPVKSLLPIWGLLLLLSILLGILWWLSCLNPFSPFCGHKTPVNSVQFNGLGDRLVSGSQDPRIIEWDTGKFFKLLEHQEIWELPKDEQETVLVIRYRPVNNNIVAAGLENGTIKLWDLTQKAENPIACFLYEEGDRVLALEFSQDSRYLFSGHGSGRVIQWEINYNRNNGSDSKCVSKPVSQKEPPFDFAVYALKFVREDRDRKLAIAGVDDDDGFFSSKLAVAGRYNQLLVWDWLKDEKIIQFAYHSGGNKDYIQSLDMAEFQPDLLVSADNQGRISLWALQQCSPSKQCQPVEQWLDGHNEQAVRSVALSADGCYLVSGGDDGLVRLWSLTSEGKLAEQNGKKIKNGATKILDIIQKQKVNSVDLKIDKEWRLFSWNEGGFFKTEEKILIASGWDNNPQVQVQQLWKNDLEYKDCNKP